MKRIFLKKINCSRTEFCVLRINAFRLLLW